MTGRDPAAVRQAHEDTARAWVDAVLVHGDTDQRSVGRMYGAVGALAAWTDEQVAALRARWRHEPAVMGSYRRMAETAVDLAATWQNTLVDPADGLPEALTWVNGLGTVEVQPEVAQDLHELGWHPPGSPPVAAPPERLGFMLRVDDAGDWTVTQVEP